MLGEKRRGAGGGEETVNWCTSQVTEEQRRATGGCPSVINGGIKVILSHLGMTSLTAGQSPQPVRSKVPCRGSGRHDGRVCQEAEIRRCGGIRFNAAIGARVTATGFRAAYQPRCHRV